MRVGMPLCKRGEFVVGIGLTAQVAFRYQDRIRGRNKKRNPMFVDVVDVNVRRAPRRNKAAARAGPIGERRGGERAPLTGRLDHFPRFRCFCAPTRRWLPSASAVHPSIREMAQPEGAEQMRGLGAGPKPTCARSSSTTSLTSEAKICTGKAAPVSIRYSCKETAL